MPAKVPDIGDPTVRDGHPVFSWDGVGRDAWWYCRLCRSFATDGHVESKTHKKFVKDWKEAPSGWDSHFNHYWKGKNVIQDRCLRLRQPSWTTFRPLHPRRPRQGS